MFPKETPILIVDDMAGARQLVITQLNAMGFTNISEAENGEIAFNQLKMAKEINMPIGLIISDWTMPVMSGLDFLAKVRCSPEFKTLPFLMVTAEGESAQVIKAIQLGVSDYVVKPFTSEVLFKKLSGIWNKTSKK